MRRVTCSKLIVHYIFSFLTILLFFTLPVFSGYNYQWRNFTRFKDQLASNEIRKIITGPTNQVWVGTDLGLLRFDGFWHNIVLINPKTTERLSNVSIQDLSFSSNGDLMVATNSGLLVGRWQSDVSEIFWYTLYDQEIGIQSNYISSVLERNNGEIWVGTSAGVSWKKPEDTNWHHVRTEQITDIYEDFSGQIWLVHQPSDPIIQNQALLTLISESNENWKVFSNQNGLPQGGVQSLTGEPGRLWVGTTKGLFVYENQTWQKIFKWPEVVEANIQALHLDQKKNLWIGTDQGILLVNVNAGSQSSPELLDKSSGLTSNNITALSQASSGEIWVGTRDNGISFSDLSWQTFQVPQQVNNRVTCFTKDSGNSIWVGTDSGIGRIFSRNSNDRLSRMTNIPIPISNNFSVRSLAYTKDGTIWAGTEAGILFFDGRKWQKLPFPNGTGNTQALIVDNDSRVWASTALLLPNDANGFLPTLIRVELEAEKPEVVTLRAVQNQIRRAVKVLSVDYRGYVWLATAGNQQLPSDLWIYKPNELPRNQMVEISQQRFGQIQTILEMDGSMWVGTNQGIYVLSLSSAPGLAKHYTTNDGLIDNNVQILFKDTGGQVWVGTSDGVSILKEGEVVKQLTASDGLSSGNVFAITETDSGEILFGTEEGLSSLKQEQTPPVTRILEGPTDYSIVGETTVTFKFIGGDASSQTFRYQYKIDQNAFRLTGDSGQENRIVLSGLTQGLHQFIVQSIDQENNVDNIGSYANFIVDSLPPIAKIFLLPNLETMVSGLFEIQGIANDNSDFLEYTMQIFSQSGARKIIHRSVEPVESSTLFSWQTRDFSDGPYTIQLNVTDMVNGQFDLQHHSQAQTDVVVDNTVPIVSLELPLVKEQASGRLNIRYFIQELNPASVRLGYQRHTSKEWIWSEWVSNLKASGFNDLYNYFWETESVDGLIDIQIQVRDKAGNIGQSDMVALQLNNKTAGPQVQLEPIKKIVSGLVSVHASIKVGAAPESEIQSSWLRLKRTDQSNWQTLWFSLGEIKQKKIATWDTATLTDGTYNIELIVTDNHRYQTIRQQTITVDNQPPLISLQKPSNLQVVSQQNNQIIGSVKDTNLERYTLSYRLNQPKVGWEDFWTSSLEVINQNTLAQWNTTNLVGGLYQLRIEANDFAGLSSQIVVDVIIDSTEVIAQMTSPETNQMVNGTIEIIGTASDENLRDFQLSFREVNGIKWESIFVDEPTISRVDSLLAKWSTPISEGTYQIRLMVTDWSNKSQTITRRVFVDNIPPIVKILNPDSGQIISDEIRITGTVDDAYLSSFQLRFQSNLAVENWRPIPVVNPSFPRKAQLLSIWKLPVVDGSYQIQLYAEDQIGHTTTQNVYVTIDNLAPKVEITSPNSGQFVSGKIAIQGRVIDQNLEKFELKVKAISTQSTSSLRIQESSQSIDIGTLVEWQTPEVESDFEIILEAIDQSGNSSIHKTLVKVDNKKPKAQISTPTFRQQIGQIVNIRGLAFDKNFKLYKIEYAADGNQSNEESNPIWFPVSKQPFSIPVEQIGLLSEWRTPTNLVGVQTIRIQVVDHAGHQSQDQVEVVFVPRLDSQETKTINSQDQKVRIIVAPNSLKAPTHITINSTLLDNEYLIEPSSLSFPAHKPAILSFQLSKSMNSGVFHWSGTYWKYIGGTTGPYQSEIRISVPIQKLGRYRLAPRKVVEGSTLELRDITCQPRIFSPDHQKSMAISFLVSQSIPVTISIYDTSERRKRLLIDRNVVEAGRNTFWWDGRDQFNERLVSDIYLVVFQAGSYLETEAIVIKND